VHISVHSREGERGEDRWVLAATVQREDRWAACNTGNTALPGEFNNNITSEMIYDPDRFKHIPNEQKPTSCLVISTKPITR